MVNAKAGRLHIIGGRMRGFRLKSVPGVEVRPTLSKVREALFNILAPGIVDSYFLDLYAGTGSIGLEAWSRGAAHVTFVEQNHKALTALRANIDHLGPTPNLEVWSQAVEHAIPVLKSQQRRYHWIFLDAPYDVQPVPLDILVDLLEDDGMVINQTGYLRAEEVTHPVRLNLVDDRKYGRTYLRFYERT